jgi:DNA-binding transcriptional LysR family regulator
MTIMNFNDISVFLAVVNAGSFSAGASASSMTRSAAGKAVARLEDRLGVRLLNRTTRALSLTDEGRSFCAHGQHIMDAVDQAEASMGGSTGVPRGTRRLTAPHAFGQRVIMPFIEEFLVRWPETQIEARFTDRMVDLLDEGFDLSIRFSGIAPDSRLVSRVLARDHYLLVASVDYVSRHGQPNDLDELMKHSCLVFSSRGHRQRWRFAATGNLTTVPIQGRLRLDSGEALHNAVVRGLGIALMPNFLVSQEVQSGRFVHILPDVTSEEIEIRCIYPGRRLLEPRVRQFIDLLANGLNL